MRKISFYSAQRRVANCFIALVAWTSVGGILWIRANTTGVGILTILLGAAISIGGIVVVAESFLFSVYCADDGRVIMLARKHSVFGILQIPNWIELTPEDVESISISAPIDEPKLFFTVGTRASLLKKNLLIKTRINRAEYCLYDVEGIVGLDRILTELKKPENSPDVSKPTDRH